MDGKLSLKIRTATRDRQAPIMTPGNVTVSDLLGEAQKQWNLPNNYEYVLRCERLGAQLPDYMTLSQAGVIEGDVLEIEPLADAGADSTRWVHVVFSDDEYPRGFGMNIEVEASSDEDAKEKVKAHVESVCANVHWEVLEMRS